MITADKSRSSGAVSGCSPALLVADGPGLLTDPAIDAFAQQVCMAVVAGILLDHVNEQFAQRDRFARTVAPDELEVGIAGELLGEGDFVVPCTPGVLHRCLIAHRTVEVAVWLCL